MILPWQVGQPFSMWETLGFHVITCIVSMWVKTTFNINEPRLHLSISHVLNDDFTCIGHDFVYVFLLLILCFNLVFAYHENVLFSYFYALLSYLLHFFINVYSYTLFYYCKIRHSYPASS